jgi:hypothetical protein
MKSKIIFALLLAALSLEINAQTPQPTQTTVLKTDSQTITITAEKTPGDADKAAADSAKTRQSSKQTGETYVRPNAGQRQKRYVKSIFGPIALARTVVGAGYGTWRNSPVEWGDRWEGFGRRLASGFGKNAIKQTTVYALDEAFKLDSAFYRSTKKDVGSRLGNALISPFTARKSDGRRVFGFPRIIGTYASSIIAYEAWYPNRFGYREGLKSGTISLGFNAAFNVIKEFVWKKGK